MASHDLLNHPHLADLGVVVRFLRNDLPALYCTRITALVYGYSPLKFCGCCGRQQIHRLLY